MKIHHFLSSIGTTLLLSFVLSSQVSYAQESDTKKAQQASIDAASNHDYMTVIADKYINDVTPKLALYLQLYMQMRPQGSPRYDKGVLKTKYERDVTLGNQESLNLDYYLYERNDSSFIKKCVFSGPATYVITFFAKYWETTINFDGLKPNEIAYSYFISDRISIKRNSNRTFTVTVEKNK